MYAYLSDTWFGFKLIFVAATLEQYPASCKYFLKVPFDMLMLNLVLIHFLFYWYVSKGLVLTCRKNIERISLFNLGFLPHVGVAR